MSQARSLTSESRCPSVCWVYGTLSFEPTQETLSKSPFLWLPSRMPLHPGGPQGSQACSSAAWDCGPAWSPMYPSNYALELRILPDQMGWCTGCLPLGVLGSLALQGCMGPASLTDTLDSRHITDLWDLGCGRLRVEEDVSEEPYAPSCHQLLCLLPPPVRKFFPLLLPTRRPTAPAPVTPTLPPVTPILCYHRLMLVG